MRMDIPQSQPDFPPGTGKAPLPSTLIPSIPPLLGPILLWGTPPSVIHPAGIPLLSRVSPADANPPTPIPCAGFRTAPWRCQGGSNNLAASGNGMGIHPGGAASANPTKGRDGWSWTGAGMWAHLGHAPTSLVPRLSWDGIWGGMGRERMGRNKMG